MGNKSLHSQLLVDLTERWLPFVEIDELQFRLNHDGVSQLFPAVHEDRQLAALDVDLQKIDVIYLDQIIEPACLNPRSIDGTSSLSLERISELVGFAEVTSFSWAFKPLARYFSDGLSKSRCDGTERRHASQRATSASKVGYFSLDAGQKGGASDGTLMFKYMPRTNSGRAGMHR
jgi:hypothetical protein